MNIIIRYIHEKFEVYFSYIKTNQFYVDFMFKIIEKENEDDNYDFLIREIIYKIFEIIKTKEQLKIILKQCNDISTFLFCCNKNLSLIDNIIGNNSKIAVIKYINPNTLSLNKDYLNEFINGLKELLNQQQILGYAIFDFEDVLQVYLEKMQRLRSLEKFLIFSDNLSDYPNYLISNKFKNYLYEIIHELILYLVERREITHDNLLDVITKKDIYFFDKKYESARNRPMEVFDIISLRITPDIFFENFRKKKIWNYFLVHGKNFVQYFLDKIKYLTYFHKIFWLFPNELFGTIYTKAATLVSERFIYLKSGERQGEYTTDLLRKDFLNIMEILTINNYSCTDFLKVIETYSSRYVNKLYLEIISSDKINLTESSLKIIMKYLSRNLNTNNAINNETILFLLEKVNGKEEFVKAILDVISNYVLKKSDFLEEEASINYKIFKYLYQYNYFHKNNRNFDWFKLSDYYEDTIDSLKDLINSLRSLKISFSEFNFLFRNYGEQLLPNLIILCLGDENKANEIYELLNNEKKKIYEIQTRLNELINCYKYFYPLSKKNNIDEIIEFQHNITTIKISDFKSGSINRKLNDFSKEANKLSRLFNLYNSSFFMALYRESKNKFKDTEEAIIKNTEREYNKLKILFSNEENGKKLESLDLFYEELRKAESKVEIVRREIGFLKTYFKIGNYISKDLEDYIIIYLSKEEMKKLFLGILNFTEAFNLQKSDFTNKINEYMKEIDNKNITLNKSKEIIDFIDNKLCVKYDYEKDEQPDIYSECIKLLMERGDCFSFALGKEESEIRNLNEFLGMDENPLLQNDDIQAFGKVAPFINSIREQCQIFNYSDEKVYEYFNKQLHEDLYLVKSFKEYINKFGLLENLYNEYLNKPEVSKTKIFSIINDSVIEIENYFKGESAIIVHCMYKGDGRKKEINITFDELNELRDRALISNPNSSLSNESNNNNNKNNNNKILDKNKLIEKEHLENSQIFLTLIGYIKKLRDYMEELNEKGYSKRIKIVIETKNKKISAKYLENNNNSKNISINIEELINNLEDLFREQTNSLLKIYQINPVMRFFYGKQFFLLSKYIDYSLLNIVDEDIEKSNIEEYKNKVISLLSYLINNSTFIESKEKEINVLRKNILNNQISDNIDKDLAKISHYLEMVFSENNITVEAILSPNMIKNDKYQGLFIVEVLEKSFEIEILNWYYRLTKNLPLSFTLLFCNEDTTDEELASFIYRALFCEYNVLFLIQNIENLSDNKRKKIINFLSNEELMENMKSTLVITYKNHDTDIYKSLLKLKDCKKLVEYETKKMSNKIEGKQLLKNIFVVHSNASGVGKSFFIKQKAKTQKLKYIYFSFGGAFNKDNIIKGLNELKEQFPNSQNEKIIFHLDLLETDNDYLTRDIIFSMAILKKYGNNDNIICFPKNIEIYIELPFGFTDFKKRFGILNAFKDYKLDINNLPPLVEKSESVNMIIDSDIQIVCGILELFENNNINNQTLDLYSTSLKNMNRCGNLIKKYFDIQKPNYYQIDSFIRIMSYQFKNFIESIYVSIEQLRNNNLLNIRSFMIDALIKITKSFIQGVFQKLISSQSNMHNFQNSNENINNLRDLALKALTTEQEMISFEKFKPSLIFFNEDKQSLSIITSCSPTEQEYKNLENLYNSQKNGNRVNKLLDYRKMNSDQILLEIQKVLNINNASLEELKYYSDSYVFTSDNFIKLILILTRIRANIPVVMMGETGCGKTSLLRVLSKLQNKGELKMKIKNIHAGIEEEDIVRFINNVEIELIDEIYLKIEIEKINFYQKKSEYELMGKKYYDEYQYFEKFRNDLPKLWVFFDEINTCDCLGLLSEILCHHTCKGKKISDDIVFFAACNPYRLITKQIEEVGLLNKKKHKKRNYVYSVNPLPHSLLNFVFDFGNLKKDDEFKYIKCIVEKAFESYKKINDSQGLIDISTNCIFLCQNFIRDYSDVSAVSLREIRRFDLLFHYFMKYFNIKKEVFNEIKDENIKMQINIPEYITNFLSKEEKQLCIDSINLSLYMCYYIRVADKALRKNLTEKLNPYFNSGFLSVPKEESLFIADNVTLERGTAKNQALLENLFSLFVCISNQIPLFIVGKPGTSKSMSVQIMYNSMKGKNSSNLLFKKFKSLYLYPYQGSETSTSKGVLNIFHKAREPLKRNIEKGNQIDFIPAVFFDEMGLAENSVNNPLKVIHSQLEYDENEHKVAFIGISNWVLDSSKMNRGISLLIPQPDLDDLIDTAKKIALSYDKNILERYDTFFEILSKTYYEYKIKIKNSKFEDFHGNRDFYHLIKIAAKKIVKYEESKRDKKLLNETEDNSYENKIIEEICISSLERNFGGFENSINIIKEIFYTFYKNKTVKRGYNVLECIKENLEDKESRYLLLVSKSSISNYLLNLIFNKMKVKYSFYLGSKFKDEHEGEDYSVKMLNKIQLQMESGGTLVLQNLEIIYPSLYDLFNQNFTKMGNKNYARIAFSSNKSYSLVDDSFKIIILVEKENILKEEPPFLNRFEKHEISFEYLLNKVQISWANYIFSLIKQMSKINSDIDLSKQLINFSLEEIQGLIYNYCKNQPNNKKITLDDALKYVFKKIVPVLSQDIIASISVNDFEKNYPEIAGLIYKIYNQKKNNLKDFLINTNKRKNIVFTFSNPLEPIFIDKNINNENNNINIEDERIKCDKLGYINDSQTNKIFISSLKSEKNFERKIREFYNNKSQNLCLLKFREIELSQLSHINFLVDSALKDFELIDKNDKNESILIKEPSKSNKGYSFYFIFRPKNKEKANKNIINNLRGSIFEDNPEESNILLNKNILIIVYLTRHFKSDTNILKQNENLSPSMISFLSNYNQIFIDNLEGIDMNFIDLICKDINEKVLNQLDINKIIENNIFHIFSCFKYRFEGNYKDINSKNYINIIISHILKNSENIYDVFKDNISKILKEKKNIIKDLLYNKNGNYLRNGDFLSLIFHFFEKEVKENLLKIIYYFEKNHILLTEIIKNELYLKYKEIKNYTEYLKNGFQKEGNSEENPPIDRIEGNNIGIVNLNLNIPSIRNKIEELSKYIKEEIFEDYLNNDQKLIKIRHDQMNDELQINIEDKNNIKLNVNKGEKMKRNLEEKIFNYFNKIALFKYLSENHNIDLAKILLEDYINCFIFKNFKESNSSIYFQFTKIILVSIKLNENSSKDVNESINIEKMLYNPNNKEKEKDIFYVVVHYITICEIYSDTIVELFSIIKLIIKYFETFDCDKLINIITKNKIKFNYFKIYEEKEKNDERFFIIIESLIIYIIEKLEDIINFEESSFYEFLRELASIFESIEPMYIYFCFKSNTIYNIKIILQLIKDILNHPEINKKDICKILNETKMFFEEEKLLLEENKISDKINDLFKKLIDLLDKIKLVFPKDINSIEMFLYEIQINKIKNYSYIQKIISLIFTNDELTPKSEQFIKYFFPKNDLIPPIKEDNSGFMQIFMNNNSPFLYELNKNKSPILEETILFYFDKLFNDYFIQLEKHYLSFNKKNLTYEELSYKYFSISIEQLESILKNNVSTLSELTNLVKLYSISYIKNYLYNYVRIITNDQLCNDYTFLSLNTFLNDSHDDDNLKNILHIYIFKLIYFKFDKNFDLFLDFMNGKYVIKKMNFYKKFDFGANSNTQDYLVLNIDVIKEYENIILLFMAQKKSNYKKDNSELIEEFRSYKENIDNSLLLDLFYLLISNNVLNEYIGKEEEIYIDKDNFLYLENLVNILHKKDILKINRIHFDLLKLVTKPNLFFAKIIKKYGKINSKKFDILIYSLRFILSIHTKINFYSLFFHQKIKDFISSNYFPGTYMEADLFLRTLPDIEQHLASSPANRGCYVCSCGYYYPIPPCGFPYSESKCVVCNEKIGGLKHILTKREGHMRIYKNLQDLNIYGGYNSGNNKNYLAGAVMTLDEYKEKIISKRPSLDYKGIKKEKTDSYKNNVLFRKINQLTYRILHFFLYSHLLFSNALDFITDQELDEYCVENMNCMEILESDWKYIEEHLKKEGISKIQIFFNYIFNDFVKIFQINNMKMEKPEIRDEFEKKMNEFITKKAKKEEYKEYELLFDKYNEKPVGDLLIKGIIQDILKPSEKLEKDFPFLKYFFYKRIISKNDIYENLKEEKDYTVNYPLLVTCLSKEGLDKAYLLQNLQNINNFSNLLLKQFSNEITREKAKKIKIGKILNNKKMEDLFEKYKNSWDIIKTYATKYECRNEMQVLNISTESTLSQFLLDNGELYHGMYLAAAYDMFIEWQNSILNDIINLNAQNGLLKSYVSLLQRKVYVQEANDNDILSIGQFDSNKQLEELLLKYVYRNCFEKDISSECQIDYYNYDNYTYDFNKMEIELGKNLLIGKKLFVTKEEDKKYLNFMAYRFEGFRNNRSSILIEFNSKYKSRELTKNEKDDILRYLNSKNIINIDSHQIMKIKVLEDIYFSLQTLLFFICKENFELSKSINDIINQLPEYIRLGHELKNFFEIYPNFSVDLILKFFENIEALCFETIRENLNEEYKKKIDEEMQNKIKHYINDKGKILIDKNFTEVIRKLISRYLVGKRSDNEIDEKKELQLYIDQEDLWENNPSKDEELQNTLEIFFGYFPLTVGQSLALYDLLNNGNRALLF